MNKAIILGNTGADPELKSVGSGRVATLSVATSRKWKGKDGTQQEKTQWHRVVAWDNEKGRQLATLLEKYVHKGDKVMVEGEIEYRTYQDKDGNTRYVTEIIASNIELLGGKGGGNEGGGNEGGKASAKPAAAKAAAKSEGFNDFPDAVEGDDLPF